MQKRTWHLPIVVSPYVAAPSLRAGGSRGKAGCTTVYVCLSTGVLYGLVTYSASLVVSVVAIVGCLVLFIPTVQLNAAGLLA